MKNLSFLKAIYTLVLVTLFILSPKVLVNAYEEEQIREFKSEITINQDTTIDIVEEIQYYFPTERHGIYWEVPVNYKTDTSFMRSTKFTLNDMYYYKPGEAPVKYTNYEKSTTNGYVTLKIGDADTYISGEYTFIIDYSLKYVNNYYDDHDEIFLNVIGPGWDIPIMKASTTISAPGEITDTVCYTGDTDSTEQNCKFTDLGNNKLGLEVTQPLGVYEGYTFAIAMPKGTLEDTTDEQRLMFLISNLGLLLPIPVSILGIYFLKKKGKNKKITIIPHYEAPEGINPSFAGYIYKNILSTKYISAEIIELAVKGYIKIKQIKKKEYELIRTSKSDKELAEEQQLLLSGLFSKGDVVNTKKMDTKFYRTVTKIRNTITSRMTSDKMYSEGKIKFKKRLGQIGGFSIILSFFVISIIDTLPLFGWFVGFLISGIILILLSNLVDRRSDAGNKIYYELMGLKMYINTAEKHRIEFHDNPEKFRGVFEALLPFAMIFNLEKKWSKEFEDIYKESPDWYEGNSTNMFNTYMLANSINTMHRSVSAKSSPPGSSSGYRSSFGSSGGSGFSGGSSGGGFGGSSGGSW